LIKDIKNTIRQSAIYGLSRIVLRGASFILIPIYTSVYASDSIANINLLESFWQYLFTFILFGAETAMINFCTKESNESSRKKLLFNFFTILLFNSIIALIFGLLYSNNLSSLVLQDTGYGRVIFYCFLISVLEAMLIMPLTIARLNEKASLYTLIVICNLIINISLQIYFIFYLKLNFEYVFLAKFLAPAFTLLICLPYVFKNIKINFESSSLKEIFRYSFPLMTAMVLSLLLNSVDRFILVYFVTKEQVAIYTTAYSIGSVTNAFILAPYTLAMNVIFWKKLDDDNFKRFMTKSSTYLFFIMMFSALIISFFIPHIIKVFVRNPELWYASNIIPIILFANCFVALFLFPTLDFYYKKRTNTILLIIVLSLLISLTLNFVFIRYFGIYASAFATVLSYLFMFFTGFIIARKFSLTKYETKRLSLLSILYIAFVYAVFQMNIQNLYLDIFIKLFLVLLYLFFLRLLGFFEPVEINKLKEIINRYLRTKLQ
jgi:O-antigen/teichoic acid export membrane protein